MTKRLIEKQFDIIVYGASGFAGQYVVEELCNSPEIGQLKWAVAGRNVEKLKKSLATVQGYLNNGMNIQNIPVIYADVEDHESLLSMCKQTELVLNCVGPYTLFGGESVVEACIECNTHHIDISAELKYLETVQVKYFETARKKQVYIIEACGIGSLPADYGISLLKQKFLPGELKAVDYFVKFEDGPKGRTVNIGTLLSGLYSIKDHLQTEKYNELLKKIFKKSFLNSDYPMQKKWPFVFYSREMSSMCSSYPGPDERVIMRSQMMLEEHLDGKPVQSRGYFELPSLPKTMLYVSAICISFLMSLFSFGRNLVSKYPRFFTLGIFSNDGPTREQVLEGSTKITFIATGWKNGSQSNEKSDSKIKLTIRGPEPAYTLTAMCMVQAGLTVLLEKDKLPLEGGVFTPGVAFEKTSLHQRLQKRGMEFEFETNC